jgi:hypothetical protein
MILAAARRRVKVEKGKWLDHVSGLFAHSSTNPRSRMNLK